ncbi:MAG TPA: GAF domain-containing protein [Pseudolysinimonas sp.]|nr:GAF domain-containing protein [Pseudolysinimonas sp.]
MTGNDAALGTGVRSHDLGVPGVLARALSSRTGYGVDVDVVAHPDIVIERLAATVRDSHPHRYHAIVLVTGSAAALKLMPVERWRRHLSQVLTEVRESVDAETVVVLAGIPVDRLSRISPKPLARLVSAHAAELDRASAEICEQFGATWFVPLPTDEGAIDRGAKEYARWGTMLADQLAAVLPCRPLTDEASRSETQRQSAVDSLRSAYTHEDPKLKRIIEMARRVFGTKSALFTVLDRDVQLHPARSGVSDTQVPRRDSFCEFTILETGGMIVEDAQLDERFRDNPFVVGEPYLRFYAGFPVHSPDGERIGALCVLDSAPRRVDEVDMSLLRELAHLVETELWRFLPTAESAGTWPRPVGARTSSPLLASLDRVRSAGALKVRLWPEADESNA